MILSLFGQFNAFLHHLRNNFKSEPPVVGAVPRSPHWATVRKQHLEKFPCCAACGLKDDVEVHHIVPFHIKPELELDEENLITLCRKGRGGLPCHYVIGHCGKSWEVYNKNVRRDAAWMLCLMNNSSEN